MLGTGNNMEARVVSGRKASKGSLVASPPKVFRQKTLKNLVSLKHAKLGAGSADQMVVFSLKVASLEILRRFSKARCPFIWQGLQALQILCYPPFKWIQRWAPLKNMVKGIQKLSRPLLFLSIATALSDLSGYANKTSSDVDENQTYIESTDGESNPEIRISGEAPENSTSESWLLQLHEELGKQGITIPERITEDDLHRFYTLANGNFSCLVSSIKRTIRWRETYSFLSSQELEMWSHLVFWHGSDVMLRPCLIIRLGLACSSLAPQDRPRFAQAVVSQIEHGVLHLVNVEDPRITVLMDCESVSAFRFPMQMMRSFSVLVQDHYPNRLAFLFVVRLPPVVRVIAQTLIQVLRPMTRKKLQIVGEMYRKVLSEHLQAVPLFLGGQCTCSKCTMPRGGYPLHQIEDTKNELQETFVDSDSFEEPYQSALSLSGNCDQILRTAIVGILVLWVFIAFLAGMYNPDSHSSPS